MAHFTRFIPEDDTDDIMKAKVLGKGHPTTLQLIF